MHVRELFSLEGRVAVVTGGSGLYGACISRALAEAGAYVVIGSRNLDSCEAAAAALRTDGLSATAVALDQTSEESLLEARATVLGQHGRVDVLVNNAVGRTRTDPERARQLGHFFGVSPEAWEQTSRVNSLGVFLCTRVFIEPMMQQRRGSIINIASIYGLWGPHFRLYEGTDMVNPADYAFNKGGLIALTRYLATCYAPYGIRVNCISPGGFYSGQDPRFVERYCHETPLGRMAGEDDIKGAAVFLASDASGYITGANIPVEGGWGAW